MLLTLGISIFFVCSSALEDALVAYNQALTTSMIEAKSGIPNLYSSNNGLFDYRWRTGPTVNAASYVDFAMGHRLNVTTSSYNNCPSYFTLTYFNLVSNIAYRMGTKDEQREAALRELGEVKTDELLDNFNKSFGPIPGVFPANLLDGYFNLTVKKWICDPIHTPVEYFHMIDLNPELVFSIFDCATVNVTQTNRTLESIYMYVTVWNEALDIPNRVLAANNLLRKSADNVVDPSEANGAMHTRDGWLPAFTLSKAPYDIYYDLHNNNSGFSIATSFYKTSNSSYLFTVNGKNATLPPDVVNAIKTLPVNYYLKYSMSYSSFTTLSIAPALFQNDTEKGWFQPSVIPEALKALRNTTKAKEESGYRFVSSETPFDYDCVLGGFNFFLIDGYKIHYKDPWGGGNISDIPEAYTARVLYAFPASFP